MAQEKQRSTARTSGVRASDSSTRTCWHGNFGLRDLPIVWVFDNNDLRTPYRLIAVAQDGRVVKLHRPVPKWLGLLLPKT